MRAVLLMVLLLLLLLLFAWVLSLNVCQACKGGGRGLNVKGVTPHVRLAAGLQRNLMTCYLLSLQYQSMA